MPAHSPGLIPTRASLLKRLPNLEDQASWNEFFNIYWKLIYGVARKAGLTDVEAQDVVQETMVSVIKHILTFKMTGRSATFKAWLLNITRWRIPISCASGCRSATKNQKMIRLSARRCWRK